MYKIKRHYIRPETLNFGSIHLVGDFSYCMMTTMCHMSAHSHSVCPSGQVFILQVQLAIIQQWLIPTALHSLQPFKEMDWAKMVERVFLLAVSPY